METISIRLYPPLSNLAGEETVTIKNAAPVTIRQLEEILGGLYPLLKERTGNFSFVVYISEGETITDKDTPLKPGLELHMLQPLYGG